MKYWKGGNDECKCEHIMPVSTGHCIGCGKPISDKKLKDYLNK